jgi:hypothetical protein
VFRIILLDEIEDDGTGFPDHEVVVGVVDQGRHAPIGVQVGVRRPLVLAGMRVHGDGPVGELQLLEDHGNFPRVWPDVDVEGELRGSHCWVIVNDAAGLLCCGIVAGGFWIFILGVCPPGDILVILVFSGDFWIFYIGSLSSYQPPASVTFRILVSTISSVSNIPPVLIITIGRITICLETHKRTPQKIHPT